MIELFNLAYLGGKLFDKMIDKPTDALIDSTIKTKKETLRIKQIHAKVNEFNISFEGTEIDSNAFQSFLNMIEIQEAFFNQIFIPSEFYIDKNVFISRISDEAVAHINQIYSEHNRQPISNKKIIVEYFKIIYSHLENIRDSFLSESERTQLKFIQKSITNAKEEILECLNQISLGGNSSNLRLELDNKLNNMRNFKNTMEHQDYELIINYLDGSMGEILDEKSFSDKFTQSNHEQMFAKAFYNACLKTEGYKTEWIGLGLNLQFFTLFREFLLFLNRNRDLLSIDDFESYLNQLMTLVDENEWKLFLYSKIYFEDEIILKFVDEFLIEKASVIAPPVTLSKNRSFWPYVIKNVGSLYPSLLDELLSQLKEESPK